MRLGFDRRFCRRFAPLLVVGAVACGTRSEIGLVADAAPKDGSGAGGGRGGSAGTAGSAGGGSGGSGGSAGSGAGGSATGGSGGATISDSGRCGCVTGHVGWGWNGGLVFYNETSALEACNLFVHQRIPTTPSPPALSCEQPLGDCAGAISAWDVVRAIAHADVQAAIAAAPVLYGEDPRAYDGQVLRIQIGSAIVEVGLACKTAACKPIPAGVDALAKQLPLLTTQELAREPCRSTFPPSN